MIQHFEIRVLLLSKNPLPALQKLDCKGICVCGVISEALLLANELRRLQPHVLLNESGKDVSDICLSALPTCPPRMIHESNNLPNAIFSEMEKPFGALAAPSIPKRETIAHILLEQMEMPPLLGRECIARGAAWLSAIPQPMPPVQQYLYPWLAQAFHTTPAAVEKRIRTAIENTWLHGNLQAQSQLFGLSVSAERGKPTNAEMLFRLSDYIQSQF